MKTMRSRLTITQGGSQGMKQEEREEYKTKEEVHNETKHE